MIAAGDRRAPWRRCRTAAAGAVAALGVFIAGVGPAHAVRPAPQAIYGDDHRHELYAVADPRLRAAADSVALLIDNNDLDCDTSGTTCELRGTQPLFGGDACADEPFAAQPTAGSCTGFLVAPDLLATAGHCIDTLACPFTAFVFGFAIAGSDGAAKTTGLETFRCAEVVESVARYGFDDGIFQDAADYALVRLDRPVDGRTPLVVRRAPAVAVGEALVVMGHPFTLPLKVADGAEVRSVARTFFQADLDISGGNSGSPVLERDRLEVVGILVRGAPDSYLDFDRGCERSTRYPGADGWLGVLSQATYAALLPVAGSCVEAGDCPATTTTATCFRSSLDGRHHPSCRECLSDGGATRKVGRNVEKGLRFLRRGELNLGFDLPRAEKALRQAVWRLERAASRLVQTSAAGRVSLSCHGALRSVIDELLAAAHADLELLAVLKSSPVSPGIR